MKTLVRVLFLSASLAAIFVLAKKQNYLRKIVRYLGPAVELGKYKDPTLNQVSEYKRETVTLLERKDFDALDKRATEALAKKERFSHGSWKLANFYDAFSPDKNEPESAWQSRLFQLNGWLTAKPGSGPAHIALAEFYTSHAWRARGAGWANSVTQQGWTLLRQRLNLAVQVLERGRNVASRDPGYWNAYQTVAMGLEWPQFRKDDILNRGVAVAPQYAPLYTAHAYAITPRWGGQPGAIKAFAERATKVPGGMGDEIYGRIAFQMDELNEDPARLAELEWPRVQAACEKMLKDFPDEPSIISRFAMLACRYGDTPLARRLFEELDDRVDLRVWDTVEDYKKHYNHAHPNATK